MAKRSGEGECCNMQEQANRLVNAITQVSGAKASQALSGAPSELGTISGGLLKLDSFRHPIPFSYKAKGLTLQDGDRVLVAPVNGGNEFVVVCVVESGVA